MKQRILVGSPVSKHHWYCTEDYIKGLLALTYDNLDILLIDNSDDEKFYEWITKKTENTKIKIIKAANNVESIKQKIAQCREILRKKVIEENYDYLFCIDQDVVPPKDSIERFLKTGKEVLSGIYYSYFKRGNDIIQKPVMYRELTQQEIEVVQKDKEQLQTINKPLYDYLKSVNFDLDKIMIKFTNKEVEYNKLIPIKSAGTGCVFINKNILEKIKFHVEENEEGFDDVIFFRDIRKLGIQAYSDTSIKCNHAINLRPWAWGEKGNKIIPT